MAVLYNYGHAGLGRPSGKSGELGAWLYKDMTACTATGNFGGLTLIWLTANLSRMVVSMKKVRINKFRN